MLITPQWKDDLRARVTLSSVIMRTVKLQRAGREWKACCPFHDEKTPSFTVNDEKGFYHCFGCGVHGDVISWLTDQRGLPFMDAIKELAAIAGLEVPRPDPGASKAAQQRASIFDVTLAAQNWFVDQLNSSHGLNARKYLLDRGFSEKIIRDFGFGYAPNNKFSLIEKFKSYTSAFLAQAGLVMSIEGKEPYDRFRDRLMLPIQDQRGRVIAFGGRVLVDRNNTPKYLNSPETELFDKGRTLYNFHRAIPASKKTKRLIVVEGYMDVVALANSKVEDVVAPMGTALTPHQLAMLWRIVDTPIICFDGDQAGRKATMRAIDRALPILQPGKSLLIAKLPTGSDPDDLIKHKGISILEELLINTDSMIETIWDYEKNLKSIETPEEKAGLKERLLGRIGQITHPDIRSLYRRDLMDRYSAYAYPDTRRNMRPGNINPAWKPHPKLPEISKNKITRLLKGGAKDEFTRAVIHGLIRYPSEIERHAEALIRLARHEKNMSQIVESLIEMSESLDSDREIAISDIKGVPAPPDNKRYTFLREGTDPVDAREELAEAVALLVERPALMEALDQAKTRFDADPEGAFAEQTHLREQLTHLNLRLKNFGRRKAGLSAKNVNSPEDIQN